MTDKCKHPPGKLYSWVVPLVYGDPNSPVFRCITCSKCGEVIRGEDQAKPLLDKYLEELNDES